MKYLYVNGELAGEAEKIVKTETSIIGYNGNSVVFAFKGIKDFSKFQLEEGQEWNVDEKTEMAQRINDLELYILSQEGLIQMLNQMLLNMLIRQVKAGNIEVEDIKNEDYKQAVIQELS